MNELIFHLIPIRFIDPSKVPILKEQLSIFIDLGVLKFECYFAISLGFTEISDDQSTSNSKSMDPILKEHLDIVEMESAIANIAV